MYICKIQIQIQIQDSIFKSKFKSNHDITTITDRRHFGSTLECGPKARPLPSNPVAAGNSLLAGLIGCRRADA